MTPEAWLGLATVLFFGAISPGPSLAYVLRNTINGGRSIGLASAVGHGIGMGCYAFLFTVVLGAALAAAPDIETPVRIAGALLLALLGIMFLRAGLAKDSTELNQHSDKTESQSATDYSVHSSSTLSTSATPTEESLSASIESVSDIQTRENEHSVESMSPSSAFGFGFALAFFNPKIAAFLLAIYSQFVVAGASLGTKMGMAALAFGIDAGWYALVAVILSGRVGSGLAVHSRRIDQLIGVLMLLFALLFLRSLRSV